MATSRTIYQYHFKLGNKIVHTGITKDLDRRGGTSPSRRVGARPHQQVGSRTTREAALRWEEEQRNQGKPTGP